jgi:Xaa-Pro dipeptidase
MAGADFPGCAVTYDIKSDQLILWIPRIEPRKVLWYGRTPSLKQCKAASEVDDVQYITDLNAALCSLVNQKATNAIYALHPDQVPRLDCVKGTLHFNTTKLKPAINRARVIKTDHEIALIRRANAISVRQHHLRLPLLDNPN